MTDLPNAAPVQRDRELDEWDLPSRAVVACDGNGHGAVLWTVGPHVAHEMNEAGMVELSDLGLDDAPLGVSIWEGVYVTPPAPALQESAGDEGTQPAGKFRPPTDHEWDAIKAGRCPWEGQA
ncbi:hypothetical protein LCGC14_0820580 [marine sediment metagenome]|uniref:Uncharacterized protein n=1 Tax=marine sediment metagenome TaxID=412755 RepID=A0A0F9PNN2_9ZZZZ